MYGAMMKGKHEWSDPLGEGCTILHSGYVTNKLPEKALDVFDDVSSEANDVLYTIAFSACADLSNERAVQSGKKYLEQMPRTFLNDTVVISSAIHMLMKFSDVAHAEDLFSRMKEHDAYSYGVMLNGYNTNRNPHKCLMLFEQLKRQNIRCNESIYISMIGACSQIGLTYNCQEILDQIPSQAKGSPALKRCIIDMWVSVSCSVDSSDSGGMSFLDREKLVTSMKPRGCSSQSLQPMPSLTTP